MTLAQDVAELPVDVVDVVLVHHLADDACAGALDLGQRLVVVRLELTGVDVLRVPARHVLVVVVSRGEVDVEVVEPAVVTRAVVDDADMKGLAGECRTDGGDEGVCERCLDGHRIPSMLSASLPRMRLENVSSALVILAGMLSP